MTNLFSEVRKDLLEELTRLEAIECAYDTLVIEWMEERPGFSPIVSSYGVTFNATVETKKDIAQVVRWFLTRGWKISRVVVPNKNSTAWTYYFKHRDGTPREGSLTLVVSPRKCRRVETGEFQQVPVYKVVCD